MCWWVKPAIKAYERAAERWVTRVGRVRRGKWVEEVKGAGCEENEAMQNNKKNQKQNKK